MQTPIAHVAPSDEPVDSSAHSLATLSQPDVDASEMQTERELGRDAAGTRPAASLTAAGGTGGLMPWADGDSGRCGERLPVEAPSFLPSDASDGSASDVSGYDISTTGHDQVLQCDMTRRF